MNHNIYLIGAGMTHFKRWPKRDHIDLAREALTEAIQDSGLTEGTQLSRVWFGNCGMHYWGQSNIRGQAICAPLAAEGLLSESPEVINVEGGCATGSLAVYGAIGDLLSGRVDTAVALGVEKTFIAHNPAQILKLFASGMNRWRAEEDLDFYRAEAQRVGASFEPSADRIILLDISALHAQAHMSRYGVTENQIAAIASKSHAHGALNPKAQYQRAMTIEDILDDHAVLKPFTRSMCAPVSDGAAAGIFVNETRLKTLPTEIQARALPILACEVAGGRVGPWDQVSPTQRAAERAYKRAGVTANDLDLLELHDATAYAEILHLEELGVCLNGEAARWSAEGHSRLDGKLPVNTSGGLISKGHPLGASGIAMLGELASQLRGEAGARQASPQRGSPRLALAHNGGGLLGFQEASTVVTLIAAPH